MGASRMVAAQLDASGRLRSACAIDRAEPGPAVTPADTHRLASALARQGFAGRDVAVALPDSMLFSGVQDLPPRSSGAPIEQIARAELARQNKVEATSLVFASWELPAPARAGEGTSLMGIAARHEDITALIDSFESVGLAVRAIEPRPLALARACAPLIPQQEGLSAIIDLGWDAARVVLMLRGVVVYERDISEAGERALRSLLHERLEVEDDVADYVLREIGLTSSFGDERDTWEVLPAVREIIAGRLEHVVRETRAAIGYALHRYGLNRSDLALVTGPGATLPGASAFLGEHLSLEARAVTADEIVGGGRGALGGGARLITAIGSALWKSGASRANLLPEGVARGRNLRRRAGAWSGLVGLSAALGAAWVLLAPSTPRATDPIGDGAQLHRLLETARQDTAQLRAEVDGLGPALARARLIGSRPPYAALLTKIAETLDDRAALQVLRLGSTGVGGSPQGLAVDLGGVAATQADAAATVRRLEELGFFRRVELLETSRRTVGEGEVVSFRVRAVAGGESP
ncbi:MAG: PilN domain-containing protein [Phycisphaeraceae bacterium]|nr:PilN domain-containing protein [Phycisphaeraceae bacterium]